MSQVVLFLCVANSARSQIAEALARALGPEDLEVHSAGSAPSVVNPSAVQVLAERNIDATGQYAKGLDQVPLERIRVVITLCAEEICPRMPAGVVHLHWPTPDPAATDGDADAGLAAFRAVRDAIEERLRRWFAESDQGAVV